MSAHEFPPDAEVFAYLETLRRAGVTNIMYGAGAYIARVFGVTPAEARGYLKRWMDTYQAADATQADR